MANSHYWTPKLALNAMRDKTVTQALTAEGWTVLRFWEHEEPAMVVATIIEAWRSADR